MAASNANLQIASTLKKGEDAGIPVTGRGSL
jgi:hypothetical protein